MDMRCRAMRDRSSSEATVSEQYNTYGNMYIVLIMSVKPEDSEDSGLS
jgi:hypothetical protein